MANRAGEAFILFKLGHNCQRQRDYVNAIKWYKENVTIEHELGNKLAEARTLFNIGLCFENLMEHSEANTWYEKSLNSWNQIEHTEGLEGLCRTMSHMGFNYSSLGEFTKSTQLYKESLVISRKIGDKKREALTLVNLGTDAENQKEYEEAIDWNKTALAILRA